mgnify:CR=1 FL=1
MSRTKDGFATYLFHEGTNYEAYKMFCPYPDIKYISVSLASVLSTTEPIFVFLFAYFINHDIATKRELLGATITILGLLIIILNG